MLFNLFGLFKNYESVQVTKKAVDDLIKILNDHEKRIAELEEMAGGEGGGED